MLQPFGGTAVEVDADAPRKAYQKSLYGKSHSVSKEWFCWKMREIKPNAASRGKRMKVSMEKN